jgi:hypothetical protein
MSIDNDDNDDNADHAGNDDNDDNDGNADNAGNAGNAGNADDAQNVGTFDSERLAEGVAAANVPTLLMVLVQLTGDMKWLEAPFLPKKARGLSDNESGGLPEDVQATVRREALAAILAWRSGTRLRSRSQRRNCSSP